MEWSDPDFKELYERNLRAAERLQRAADARAKWAEKISQGLVNADAILIAERELEAALDYAAQASDRLRKKAVELGLVTESN